MTDVPPSFSEEFVSTLNSSVANLGSGASFTGTGENVVDYETLAITFKADQPVLITVNQSSDGINWDFVQTYTVPANSGDARTFELLSSFVQVIVTNTGGSTTTFLRLQSIFSPGANAVPNALTQLGNFKVAILEGLPNIQGVSGLIQIGAVSGIVGVSGIVNVDVLNFPVIQGVSGTVNIGNAVSGVVGVSGIVNVDVLNFPITQGVSGLVQIGSVSGIVGVSGIVNVDVLNFPQTQGVSGLIQIGSVSGVVGVSGIVNVDVLNFPVTQGVSGLIQIGSVSGVVGVSGIVNVDVLNFPQTQGVSGTVNIGNAVSGIVGVSGTVNVDVVNFPTTQGVSGSVSILNFPQTQGVSGTVTDLQGTVPWVTRDQADGTSGTLAPIYIMQVGGTDVSGNLHPLFIDSKGTLYIAGVVGVSGNVNTTVTNFPVTQGVSGTVTVIQGTSGSTAWSVKDVADGVSGQAVPGFSTQVAGSDVGGILRTIHTDVSGVLYENLQDGFGNKISSNSNGNAGNQLLHVVTPDTTTATTTFSAVSGANSHVVVAMQGLQSAGFQLNAGTFVGTLTPQASVDGGNTWQNVQFYNPTNQSVSSSLVFSSPNGLTILGLVGFPGISHMQVQVTAYTSGSATCLLRAATVNGSSPSTTISAAFGTVVNSAITMPSNTPTLLAAANSNRKYLAISNNSGSAMQIQFTNSPTLTGTTGLQIPARTYYEFKGDNLFTGTVYGFAAGGITVSVVEGTP